MPVTLNGGMVMPAWYDIKDLSSRGNEDYEGIENTEKMSMLVGWAYFLVKEMLVGEIESGVPADRIVLGGFSQGEVVGWFING